VPRFSNLHHVFEDEIDIEDVRGKIRETVNSRSRLSPPHLPQVAASGSQFAAYESCKRVGYQVWSRLSFWLFLFLFLCEYVLIAHQCPEACLRRFWSKELMKCTLWQILVTICKCLSMLAWQMLHHYRQH